MKIKLDENLPIELAELLTAQGHDVHTVPGESLVGETDETIFRAAVGEDRVLLTQDLDFSDMRKFAPGTHPGIVLLRLQEPSRKRIIDRVRQTLASESIESWAKCIVVVSNRKLRVRRP